MNDYATFVTEPIWCDECALNLTKTVMAAIETVGDLQKLWCQLLRAGNAHILVGRISATSSIDLIIMLDIHLRDQIERALCHRLKVAMVGDLPQPDEEFLLTFNAGRNPEGR